MSNTNDLATLVITTFSDAGSSSVLVTENTNHIIVNNTSEAEITVTTSLPNNTIVEKTKEAAVLYVSAPGVALSGPQGIQGVTGATGPTGPTGYREFKDQLVLLEIKVQLDQLEIQEFKDQLVPRVHREIQDQLVLKVQLTLEILQ